MNKVWAKLKSDDETVNKMRLKKDTCIHNKEFTEITNLLKLKIKLKPNSLLPF